MAKSKREYWQDSTAEHKVELANLLGTSVEYLRQVFLYDRHCGAEKARALYEVTGVGAHLFCPSVFKEQDVLFVSVPKQAA